MICKGVLLICEELLHFVFVYHHLFVGVLTCFGVFDAFYDFDKVTARPCILRTLSNFSVLGYFCHDKVD